MPLSEVQRRQLNQQCNRLPLDRLILMIRQGQISFPDDLPELSEERKQAISAQLGYQVLEKPVNPARAENPVKPEIPARKEPETPAAPEKPVAEQEKPLEPAISETPAAPAAVSPLTEDATLADLYEYIVSHPANPDIPQVRRRLAQLKTQEIDRMKELQSNYPVEDLLFFLEKGIFTEHELIGSNVATTESLQILRRLDEMKDSLPDVNEEIRKCRMECTPGRTDVFLFGIPSTGKTCILMGLIGSPHININTVRGGGPYSCVLEQYLDSGFTIGQTPKDFVATIEADISDGTGSHQLNLVEMAGEDFAFKIADNENGIVSFEDMGTGATRLLSGPNRKAIFIIVDPTAKTVRFNHLVNETDQFGNVRTFLVTRNVNQKIILKRLVDLLSQPENQRILRNVDSINVIISKADVLGYGPEREKVAYARFMEQHSSIVGPLTRLCRQYGINKATGGIPMLYTFSLGRFYVGGIYQYDPTDANKLVEVLRNNTPVLPPLPPMNGYYYPPTY